MNQYDLHIHQANELIQKFIKEPTQLYAGDALKEAIAELDQVDLDIIKNRQEFKEERQKWLALQLKIVATLDQFYEPNSFPSYFLKVLPPEIDGVYYPFPIDPKEIKDSKKRAEYEQTIEENERNRRAADLQLTLKKLLGKDHNLDPRFSYIEELKKKINFYYSEYAEDKAEYKQLIDNSSLTNARKEEFYPLL